MESSNGQPTTQNSSEDTSRRRKLSKLQKRKKSRLRREQDGLPFSSAKNDQLLEFSGKNISSLDQSGVLSQRYVPSLTKLCLENEAVYTRYSCEDLPGKIQTLLHHHLLEKHMKSAQLQWALNILEIANKNQHFYLKTKPGEELKLFSKQVPLEPKACLSGIHSQGLSEDEKTANCSTNYIPRNCIFGTEDLDWKAILSALCIAVDLLLPRRLHTSKQAQRPHTGVNEEIEQATTTAIVRVKIFLKKRYPNVVAHLFENALIYVFWMRGDMSRTLELFRNAAARGYAATSWRASLLCEMARLLWLTGDIQEATRCLHQVGQTMASQHRGSTDHIECQVLQQTAALWDQGPQSSLTAKHALTSWSSVLHSVEGGQRCLQAAVDSFLFIHSGLNSDEGTKDWMKWVKGHLTSLSKMYSAPFIHHLLAIVSALQGLPQESCVHYSSFVQNRLQSESAQYSQSSELENPWKSLADSVRAQPTPVDVISLVWRIQLCHPVHKLNSHHGSQHSGVPHVAHLITDRLNLRLTPDGVLTGDFQLLLPPVNPVLLDPHTGKLLHKEEASPTSWHSQPATTQLSRLSCEMSCFAGLFSPRLTCLYDHEGVTVDMFLWNSPTGTMHDCTLYWTGPEGERSKLRVKQFVREDFKKVLMEQIAERYQKRINPDRKNFHQDKRNHELWRQIMLELLEKYHKGGQQYTLNSLSREAGQLARERAASTSKSPQGGAAKTREKPRPYRLYYIAHRVINRTLIISLCDESYGADRATILLFVQCCSKQAFLNKTRSLFVHTLSSPWTNAHGLWFDLDLPGGIYNHQHLGGDIRHRSCDHMSEILLCTKYCSVGTLVDNLLILSEKGEVIDECFFTDREDVPYDIIGRVIYGAHPDRTRVVADHGDHIRMSATLSGQILDMERAANTMLVLTSGGLHILDPASLKLVPVRSCSTAPLEVDLSSDQSCSRPLISFDQSNNDTTPKVHVLDHQTRNSSASDKITRIALQCGHYLILADFISCDGITKVVEVIWARQLPGTPREVCFISQTDGFLVTFPSPYHIPARDNMLQFGYDGVLLRALLGLGSGSHDLAAIYLHGDNCPTEPDTGKRVSQLGWYVYFRDQLGGRSVLYTS